ncbi:MAG: hypothetical protein JNM71_12615 [Flavobacterium lindanitolerans]|uniref:hypothetical protein n=1 Tax=Flavobacterium lindanitolerans TaxID=428988 RepID=UPI001A57CBD2|nr:hypothetical protein [Flavobacterium lindanitolerans]MBL7868849.1 hypothetical protein [Flavobacterium lindanitolerans]
MSTRKKITDNYFHGVGSVVAVQLNVSDRYVRDVLNGKYDDRKTELVKNIKTAAEKFKKQEAN